MKIFSALAALFFSLPATAIADPVTYPAATEIHIYLKADLQREEQTEFQSWKRKKAYFGAIYVSSDSDDVFWTFGYNTLDGATAAAKIGCQATTSGDPEACELLATSVPKGFGQKSQKSSISAENAQYYRQEFLKNQSDGSWGAFAASRLSQVGGSWGYPTRADAEEVAISFCQTAVKALLSGYPSSVRKTFARLGLDKCHVIQVVSP